MHGHYTISVFVMVAWDARRLKNSKNNRSSSYLSSGACELAKCAQIRNRFIYFFYKLFTKLIGSFLIITSQYTNVIGGVTDIPYGRLYHQERLTHFRMAEIYWTF